MNVYPEFFRAMFHGELGDLSGVNWGIQFVDQNYSYYGGDTALDDLSIYVIGDPETLPTVTGTAALDGFYIAGDTDPAIDVSGLALNDLVSALVVFIDTGSAATSTLVCHIDTRVDTTSAAFESDGSDEPVSFPPSGVFLRL